MLFLSSESVKRHVGGLICSSSSLHTCFLSPSKYFVSGGYSHISAERFPMKVADLWYVKENLKLETITGKHISVFFPALLKVYESLRS